MEISPRNLHVFSSYTNNKPIVFIVSFNLKKNEKFLRLEQYVVIKKEVKNYQVT